MVYWKGLSVLRIWGSSSRLGFRVPGVAFKVSDFGVWGFGAWSLGGPESRGVLEDFKNLGS